MTDEYDFLKDVAEEGANENKFVVHQSGITRVTLPSTATIGTTIKIETKDGHTVEINQPSTFAYDLGPNFILTREIFDEIYNAGKNHQDAADYYDSDDEITVDDFRDTVNLHTYLLKKYNLESRHAE